MLSHTDTLHCSIQPQIENTSSFLQRQYHSQIDNLIEETVKEMITLLVAKVPFHFPLRAASCARCAAVSTHVPLERRYGAYITSHFGSLFFSPLLISPAVCGYSRERPSQAVPLRRGNALFLLSVFHSKIPCAFLHRGSVITHGKGHSHTQRALISLTSSWQPANSVTYALKLI